MRSYFFLPGACVSADAATRFTFAGVLGLRSSFAASLATLLEVCSFVGFFAAAILSALFRDGCMRTPIVSRKRAGTPPHATTQAAYSSRVARSALAFGLGRFSSLKA